MEKMTPTKVYNRAIKLLGPIEKILILQCLEDSHKWLADNGLPTTCNIREFQSTLAPLKGVTEYLQKNIPCEKQWMVAEAYHRFETKMKGNK